MRSTPAFIKINVTPVLTDFKDGLDPSKKYLTAFVSAGIANQIISLLHLLEIALHIRDEAQNNRQIVRTPILPPFAPIHVNPIAGYLHFGDVFDIPRLSTELGMEIIEWRDLKDLPERLIHPTEEIDELGCWSLTFSIFPKAVPKRGSKDPWPWHGDLPSFLQLDVSWTGIPSETLIVTSEPRGGFPANLAKLSTLGGREERERALISVAKLPTVAEKSKKRLEPEEQLLCFDFLFYSAFEDVSCFSFLELTTQ